MLCGTIGLCVCDFLRCFSTRVVGAGTHYMLPPDSCCKKSEAWCLRAVLAPAVCCFSLVGVLSVSQSVSRLQNMHVLIGRHLSHDCSVKCSDRHLQSQGKSGRRVM